MAFTFFFRDQQVLERVVEHLLPILSGRSHPRIWDAGSAMGQEPYTLAIILAERMGHFGFNNLRRSCRGCPKASWKSISNLTASTTTFV